MQMDMQEPGEMCSRCRKEHRLAFAQRVLAEMTGSYAGADHIIISSPSMTKAT